MLVRLSVGLLTVSTVLATLSMSELYAQHAQTFVGGYTVQGTNIVSFTNGSSAINTFSVPQECICNCTATTDGIYCTGANPGNAFTAIAYQENQQWLMDQVSVGGAETYKALFRFGTQAGGEHSATGAVVPSEFHTTVFRARQSAIGCSQGIGAAACLAVCGDKKQPTAPIKAKCKLD